jgi:hypothetical protein
MSILSKLIQSIGWHPAGKSVLLKIDDSISEEIKGIQIVGKISSLNNKNSALITLENPLSINDKVINSCIAICRHDGYDFFRLYFGFIATDLAYVQDSPENKIDDSSLVRFAIASIKTL